MPLVPAEALSGLALSHATSSRSVLAGKFFLAMIRSASNGMSEVAPQFRSVR
jgi:hypothetical protein